MPHKLSLFFCPDMTSEPIAAVTNKLCLNSTIYINAIKYCIHYGLICFGSYKQEMNILTTYILPFGLTMISE